MQDEGSFEQAIAAAEGSAFKGQEDFSRKSTDSFNEGVEEALQKGSKKSAQVWD